MAHPSDSDDSIPPGKRLMPYGDLAEPGAHYRALERVSEPYPAHMPRAHRMALRLELPAKAGSVFNWPADERQTRNNLVALQGWLQEFLATERRVHGKRFLMASNPNALLYSHLKVGEHMIGQIIHAVDRGTHPSEMLPLVFDMPLSYLQREDHETARAHLATLRTAVDGLRRFPEPRGVQAADLQGVREFKQALLHSWLPQLIDAEKRERALGEAVEQHLLPQGPSEDAATISPLVRNWLERIANGPSTPDGKER